MLETHQAFDTIYTFFPLCVDILGNIGKYIRRVFMQCFGVEVFGSFFSVSAPTLIPQKERIPQQAQQDLCDTAPHHSGHTTQGTPVSRLHLDGANSQGMPPSCSAVTAQTL